MDSNPPSNEPAGEETLVEAADVEENPQDLLMLEAIDTGDFAKLQRLFSTENKPDVHYRDPKLRTPLHLAAEKGNLDIVQFLLGEGAVWNATDFEGISTGEYASRMGHKEVYTELINAGCRAELILSCVEKNEGLNTDVPVNQDYLLKPLKYIDDKLIDANGNGVMMGWEAPLMDIHAKLLCQSDPVGDILNVGFGLGIIDTFIQSYKPRTHTIIEAHPDVYKHMLDLGWDKKPGVRILFGRWQDVVDQLVPGGYDGIYFDTFGEFYDQLKAFHEIIGDYLRPNGTYSFFNGLGATNQFFHDVYCQIVQMELEEMGFNVTWLEIPIDPNEETWKDIAQVYWTLKTYRLPTCKYQ